MHEEEPKITRPRESETVEKRGLVYDVGVQAIGAGIAIGMKDVYDKAKETFRPKKDENSEPPPTSDDE